MAVFTGLDKITGRIITFDVYTDETVQFGALRVTPRVCYSRPPTEAARTDAFVEVDEITLDNEVKRIFSGWMFAASPGLNAVEHPVFDVWLNDCRQIERRVAAGRARRRGPGRRRQQGNARERGRARRADDRRRADTAAEAGHAGGGGLPRRPCPRTCWFRTGDIPQGEILD